MASLARKTEFVLSCQLIFLSATWLAGIYVNGFVPVVPGTPTELLLLNPAIGSHVILASLSAATGALIVGLGWASGSKRLTALTLLSLLAIVVAGDSGLAFVLGSGSDAAQSMIMATAFVTAVFLTFFSIASVDALGASAGASMDPRPSTRGAGLLLCYLALLFFYLVFVSGIYVNLFVVGPIFSLPLNSELDAFMRSEHSTPFIAHEALGGALLATLTLLVISLLAGGRRRLSLLSAVPALLVSYSAFVGSLNLVSPPAPAVPVLVPMFSSAGLMAAIILTMLITLKTRSVGSLR